MTMQDLNLAAQFADRLVLLDGGQVVAEGDAEAVLDPAVLREHYGAEVTLVDGPTGSIVVPVNR